MITKVKVLLCMGMLICLVLPGCISPKKLDAFVAEQYNNELPRQEKLQNADIIFTSTVPYYGKGISISTRKTSKVLPLIIYWQYDYRHTCRLNPVIGINHMIKAVNSNAQKLLTPKLEGKKLGVTIEEMPAMFSLVDKGGIFLLVSWHRLFVEPDKKDLIASYTLTDAKGTLIKTSRIIITNKEQNQGIRFAQSWKSSSSEFFAHYAQYMNKMGKELVERIAEDL